MQRLLRSLAALALFASAAVFASVAFGQSSPPASKPSPAAKDSDATDLSILYAGSPGGEREKHFVEFLEQWFPEVHSISLEALNSETAAPFDVVVADWMPHYKNGSYQQGTDPKPHLDPKYAKPTICVASIGSAICGGKLDWL